jgi:hypothetical protein
MNESEEKLLRRMITESGEMWRASRDRQRPDSEVIICERPERSFYLHFTGNIEGNINGWIIETRPLTMDDAREFFAAFGSHWAYWIGAVLDGGNRLRAYVKNGRNRDWTISIGLSE